VIEQWLILLSVVFVILLLALLVDYRKLYCFWLFTLPLFRNLLNVKTAVSDLKLPYILFCSVFLGWLYSVYHGSSATVPGGKAFRRLYLALGILFGITVLAVLASPTPFLGIRFIVRTGYVIAIILISVHLLGSHEQIHKILKVWSLSLLTTVLLGFAFYSTGFLVPGYVISTDEGSVAVELVGQDLLADYQITDDAASVKRYAVGLGNLYDTSADFALVGLLLFMGWATYLHPRGLKRSAWLVCGLCSLALLLTYTRGAWLSVVAGIFLFAYARKKQWRLLVAGVAAIVFLALMDPAKIADRAVSVDASLLGRAVRLTTAMDIIREKPLLGAGPGVFTQQLTDSTENWQWLDQEGDVTAHSAIIQYLGEQGVLGLAALSWLFACYFGLGWRIVQRLRTEPRRNDIMACAVFSAFVALALHSFALPAFEDSFWATFAIGYVLAVQSLDSWPSLAPAVRTVGGLDSLHA
jgi:O-antigen ligase